MLPCKNDCPNYYEGCHKTCAKWSLRCRMVQMEQQRKRIWLKEQNEVNGTVLRQFRAMCACRSYH
jgi:hypothetical protein